MTEQDLAGKRAIVTGGASGIVATSRLTGQAVGAALVAWCLTLSHSAGTGYALALAAGIALVGAAISFARIRMPG